MNINTRPWKHERGHDCVCELQPSIGNLLSLEAVLNMTGLK